MRAWLTRARVAWTLLAVVVVGLALLAFAFLIGPRRLVVHRETLALPRWPPALAGVKLALLADLHVGSPHWGLERTRELVARTNAEDPDVILLAGDYVITGVIGGDPIDAEPIADVLGGLRARSGVIAVLGNHDWWYDGERLMKAFRARGIAVLENEVRELSVRGQRLCIVGLADLLTRIPNVADTIDQVPAGCPALVLMHEPDQFTDIDARPVLTLAGHSHGGQVALPFVGRPIVPSKHGQRYAAGLVVEGGRSLFVTTGVGTSIFPVRFGVPPEIALLTLR
jgi:predicted MPP superfamily phosphohydrolase